MAVSPAEGALATACSSVGGSLASTLKDTPPGPSLSHVSSDLETQQGTINHKSTENECVYVYVCCRGTQWGKRREEREGVKVAEERRQSGPSDTCHSWFGLWTSVAGRVAA